MLCCPMLCRAVLCYARVDVDVDVDARALGNRHRIALLRKRSRSSREEVRGEEMKPIHCIILFSFLVSGGRKETKPNLDLGKVYLWN